MKKIKAIKAWEVKIGRFVYVTVGEKPIVKALDIGGLRGAKADYCMVDEAVSEKQLYDFLLPPKTKKK
jgi:hypothetical protein